MARSAGASRPSSMLAERESPVEAGEGVDRSRESGFDTGRACRQLVVTDAHQQQSHRIALNTYRSV